MYNSSSLPFELGDTQEGTDSGGNLVGKHLVGRIYQIVDPRPAYRGHPLTVMVCRNVSAAALLGKRYGLLKTDGGLDYAGHVTGYAHLLSQANAVAIDDQLPSAGVGVNDLFYVILKGFHTVLTPNAGAAFNGDIAAAGALVAATAAGSTTSLAGRVSNVTLPGQTGATDSFNAAVNLLGRGLTARTTGNTDTDLLTYVRNSVLV